MGPLTWGWVMAHPGSREAEGEGGEGFYIAQSSRCPDLLVIWGGMEGESRWKSGGGQTRLYTR